jgi:hypothetical protein
MQILDKLKPYAIPDDLSLLRGALFYAYNCLKESERKHLTYEANSKALEIYLALS